MENPELAQVFDEVADLLEVREGNPFRVRAYRNAARTLRDLPKQAAEIAADPDRRLDALPGIGADLAGKIQTLLATGDLPLRRELRAEVPAGLRDFLGVPGLGPKRAQALYRELGVRSLDQLREAARQHRVRDLKGFGAKTEEAILRGLDHLAAAGHRVYLAEAKVYADALVRWLRAVPEVKQVEAAGSFRRRKETVGDLDLLAAGDRPDAVMNRLAEFDEVAATLARGGTKMTVRLRIAVTDHSRRVTMAHGLDAARLRRHWRAIDSLAGVMNGMTILKGVELDILEDGRLDLPDDVLAEADYVVASIHYGQKQPRERITQRLLNAVRHPFVHAIGHPTGRLIGRRPGYDVDLEAVLKAAAEHGCLMELNCQPSRLDLDDVALAAARDLGEHVVLGTDAHSVEELAFLEFGVYQARRAGLEVRHVANARPLNQFRRLLKPRNGCCVRG